MSLPAAAGPGAPAAAITSSAPRRVSSSTSRRQTRTNPTRASRTANRALYPGQTIYGLGHNPPSNPTNAAAGAYGINVAPNGAPLSGAATVAGTLAAGGGPDGVGAVATANAAQSGVTYAPNGAVESVNGVPLPGPGQVPFAMYPAITHFTDAVSALPREFQRHASLLKEVDSKAWRLEDMLSQQLHNAATSTPFTTMVQSFLKDLAAQDEDAASLRSQTPPRSNTTATTTTTTTSTTAASASASASTPASVSATSSADSLTRRRLFSDLHATLTELMVTADEKNHVLWNANKELQKHMYRLETVYQYVQGEVSEETRLGNKNHWAYNKKPEKPVRTSDRPRREPANHGETTKETTGTSRRRRGKNAGAEEESGKARRGGTNTANPPAKRRRVEKTVAQTHAAAHPASHAMERSGSNAPSARAASRDVTVDGVAGAVPAVAGTTTTTTTTTTTNTTTKRRRAPAGTSSRSRKQAAGAGAGGSVASATGSPMPTTKSPVVGGRYGTGSPMPGAGAGKAAGGARAAAAGAATAAGSGGVGMERTGSGAGARRARPSPAGSARANTAGAAGGRGAAGAVHEDVGGAAYNDRRSHTGTPAAAGAGDAGAGMKREELAGMSNGQASRSTPFGGDGQQSSVGAASARQTRNGGNGRRTASGHGAGSSSNGKAYGAGEDGVVDRSRPPSQQNVAGYGLKREKDRDREDGVAHGHAGDAASLAVSAARSQRSNTQGRPDGQQQHVHPQGAVSRQNQTVHTHQQQRQTQTTHGGHSTRQSFEEEDEYVEEDSESEPRYCYCNQVSYGEMVACDKDDCEREWFHLACVGLSKPPGKSAKWYCNECKEKMRKAKSGGR